MSETTIMSRLKELRGNRKISQEAAAEGCGISRIALARYENGTRVPTTEIIVRLANFYGVSTDYIIGMENPTPAPKVDIMVRSDIPNYLEKLSPKNRALLEEMARKLFELQQQEEKK